MKKAMFFFVSLFVLSCSSTRHYTQLTTGEWISKKQYDKFIQNAIDSAWSHLTEQDKSILNDTSFRVVFEIQDSTNH